MLFDTICAPATAPVNSAISVIRISGRDSLAVASSIFSNPAKILDRHAAYGSILSDGEIVDDVILLFYKGPKSFTGEDVVEIICHGNPVIVSKIMKLLFNKGARAALPGEFTQRAFLNGKVDLTEAEAINTLINSRSDWEIKKALEQMHGAISKIVSLIKDRIIELKADIEAGIDFSEEDIEFVSYDEAKSIALSIKSDLEDFLRRCRVGERVSKGIDVILAGRPNVGKSSLLNLILNEDRAIVSDIPGTTRDIIRESVQIGGVRINLTDTAGIAEPGDDIERIGIELSKKKISDASIVVAIIDARDGFTDRDREIFELFKDKRVIYVINKKDLVDEKSLDNIRKETGIDFIAISAKSGDGFKELEKAIADIINNDFVDYSDSFIADARIQSILNEAIDILCRIISLFESKELPEIIASELNELIYKISEITGEISADDILGSIFRRFCIGK